MAHILQRRVRTSTIVYTAAASGTVVLTSVLFTAAAMKRSYCGQRYCSTVFAQRQMNIVSYISSSQTSTVSSASLLYLLLSAVCEPLKER
jgi:uncharacterized membrane protein